MTKRSKRRERRYSLLEIKKILALMSRTGPPEDRIDGEEASIRVEVPSDGPASVIVSWRAR